jgi:anaerobic ribonucleoside-triphosphate reductase activating protein
MRDYIYVYMKEPAVHVLGPGSRYVLWVQGCEQRCPGCVAENARNMENGKPVGIDALAIEIALSKAEGLTISGGEPFLQAKELARMLDIIAEKRDMGVIVYTGYRYEDLMDDTDSKQLLSRIDLLIDGPYVQKLDDGKSLRGSSNQRVIPITDRYKDYLSEYGTGQREKESFFHGIYVHEIGIPDNTSN